MNSTEKFIDGWDGISSEGDGATGRHQSYSTINTKDSFLESVK